MADPWAIIFSGRGQEDVMVPVPVVAPLILALQVQIPVDSAGSRDVREVVGPVIDLGGSSPLPLAFAHDDRSSHSDSQEATGAVILEWGNQGLRPVHCNGHVFLAAEAWPL